MRVALVNPRWTFDGSIYFGCREPHLPLEYGYARALLGAAGHDARIVDAQLEGLDARAVHDAVEAFAPDLTVITTAPSYLFWRCAPPELRVPRMTAEALRDVAGALVVVGPHASTTPVTTLRKVGADAAIVGECEEAIVALAGTPRSAWTSLESVAVVEGDDVVVRGPRAAVDVSRLPALRWTDAEVEAHGHHHHRFDRPPSGPGAEVEATRGCPYACTFCAKDNFRSAYRRRPLAVVLDEIDALARQGAQYLYFVDEIFLPDRALLDALAERRIAFGVQMRIDNWSEDSLDSLGRAGCVSIEAGVESITDEGRTHLAKRCRASTDDLTRLLLHAKRRVPFVQANLMDAGTDDPADVARWREQLHAGGVWANEPVPMFPYPGSPEYTRRWGTPDDRAWERAHEDYLARFGSFSDIQNARPAALRELERRG